MSETQTNSKPNLEQNTSMEKPRIVIFGAGGVGGYLAARLAECGHSYVHVIARGSHLKAIEENDKRIILKSIDGDCSPQLDSIGDSVESVLKTATTPIDAVIFTCKMDQLASAAESMLPLFSEKTIAVPTQNGVEAPEVLAKVVGEQRVVGGYVQVLAYISKPGVILHEGWFVLLVLLIIICFVSNRHKSHHLWNWIVDRIRTFCCRAVEEVRICFYWSKRDSLNYSSGRFTEYV